MDLPPVKSSYLSNKQLGDELCYVLQRQEQPKFMGNTLEKPQLLLKKTEVRETTFTQESLSSGEGFKAGGDEKKPKSKKKHGFVGALTSSSSKKPHSFINP